MPNNKVPVIKLNNNASIPVLGFGTWQLEGETCRSSVEKALETGYRHIDTAAAYGNHKQVGKAVRASHIPRRALFITSKIRRENLKAPQVAESCKLALEELGMDYLDLYLIHWPNRDIPIAETLEALGRLQDERLVRAIGVSNFTIRHLEEAKKTGIKFTVNQIEFHPSLNQKELKSYCDKNNIVVTAYSPIAQGKDLQIDLVQQMAKKYGKSASQVVLNWIIGKGMVAIPRSSTEKNIIDNFKAIEWKLDASDIGLIDGLKLNYRVVNPSFNEFDY